MVSSRHQIKYNDDVSRCSTRQHHSSAPSPRSSLGLLADVQANTASSVISGGSREYLNYHVRDDGAALSDLIAESLSEVPEETRCPHGDVEITIQHSSGHEYYVNTPFTALASNSKGSRWQERSSYYKNNHVLLKKARRQRNRIAISLLTIALPLELRHSSIRPLNEEIRRLGWWENREGLDESQRTQLDIYREIQREWQKLIKA